MKKPYIHGMLPDVSAPNSSASSDQTEPREIRFLGDMQRLQPNAGDVFVLTCESRLDHDTARRIKAMVSGALGGATVLVLDGGLKLGVVGKAKPASVVVNNTLGDVISADALKVAFRVKHPLTASEKEEVAAYRVKWKGVISDWQSDAEVLALSRINPT